MSVLLETWLVLILQTLFISLSTVSTVLYCKYQFSGFHIQYPYIFLTFSNIYVLDIKITAKTTRHVFHHIFYAF